MAEANWFQYVLKTIIALLAVSSINCQKARQNIVLMLADDLGWADVENNDAEMRTPNLQALAAQSTLLSNSYMQPTCAPSRAALLSGRYPHKIGMQSHDIYGYGIDYMNASVATFPEQLQDLGYKTHLVGKWHLGFCDWALTPTGRGFDTFYGFFAGAQGYKTHAGNGRKVSYDFWDVDATTGKRDIAFDANGTFSTYLHTERASKIIREAADDDAPFFIYMSYQSVHAPWEVESQYETHCSHVEHPVRRLHCGMVYALDESVGNITRTLEEEGLMDSTTIIFMSDNGGPVEGGSSNWPYRGKKATLWEGGIKSYTLVKSPDLSQHKGQTYDGLVHVVDWAPTILEIAGGSAPSIMDGQSVVAELRNNEVTPASRDGFVISLDDRNDRFAMRMGKWKLMENSPGSARWNGWYKWDPTLQQQDLRQGKRERRGGESAVDTDWDKIKVRKGYQLFDLEADPQETNDLYKEMSEDKMVKTMRAMMETEKQKTVDPWRGEQPSSECGSALAKEYGAHYPGFCDVSKDRQEVAKCPVKTRKNKGKKKRTNRRKNRRSGITEQQV